MRILQISSARTLGGGERHLADLANGLARRGHEIFAAVTPNSPLRDQLSDVPSDHIVRLPLRHALDLPSAVRLARIVRERRIQLVHAHLARDYPLAAFAAGRASGARLVVTRHVLFPLGRAHAFILGRVARVIAVSGAVARALRAQALFPEDKVRVVQNGVDVARLEAVARVIDRQNYRRELGVAAPMLVGTVGELSEVKGQLNLVRAAALVARELEGVGFLVVGEDSSRAGDNRARIEDLISELKLEGRVRLAGRRADVAEILSCLDVFVNASRSEAFGLATVEAMACGAAVVATATEGARELIEDEATGLLVPVGDAPALAAAIMRLLKDEARRALLSDNARRRARARWGIEQMVEATERVYFEAIGSN